MFLDCYLDLLVCKSEKLGIEKTLLLLVSASTTAIEVKIWGGRFQFMQTFVRSIQLI